MSYFEELYYLSMVHTKTEIIKILIKEKIMDVLEKTVILMQEKKMIDSEILDLLMRSKSQHIVNIASKYIYDQFRKYSIFNIILEDPSWAEQLIKRGIVVIKIDGEKRYPYEQMLFIFYHYTQEYLQEYGIRNVVLTEIEEEYKTGKLWKPEKNHQFPPKMKLIVFTFLLVHNRLNLARLLPRYVVYKIFNYLC